MMFLLYSKIGSVLNLTTYSLDNTVVACGIIEHWLTMEQGLYIGPILKKGEGKQSLKRCCLPPSTSLGNQFLNKNLILIQLGCLERRVVVGERLRRQHQPVAHLVLSSPKPMALAALAATTAVT